MSKYLFVVHSSITLRMARAIISEYGWPGEACIFLIDRGFGVEEDDIETLDITNCFIEPIRWKERKDLRSICRKNRYSLRLLNTLLNEKVATEYHLFLPHSNAYAYQALIRHPLCRRYAFVEEGMLSYRTYFYNYTNQPAFLKRILLQCIIRLCLGRDFQAFPEWFEHQDHKYNGCYGISEHTFPTLPKNKKHIVPAPFVYRPEYAEIRHFMVAGPWIEKGYCKVPEYRQMKRALFLYWIAEGIEVIHVKFHPRQYHEGGSIPLFRSIAAEFADRVTLIELPPEASPEEVAYSSQADFYLLHSSSTIYASQFGCRVYSYAETVRKHWPASREFVDHLPPVITQNLIPIELPLEKDASQK